MRKVQVTTKTRNIETKLIDITTYIADFHGFGMDYEEYESDCASYSIAIVEKEDGTIEMPRADRIKFIDKE